MGGKITVTANVQISDDTHAEIMGLWNKLDDEAQIKVLRLLMLIKQEVQNAEKASSAERKLARLRVKARNLGIGIHKKYNATFGEDGYMLCDIAGNYVIAGSNPIPFSLSFDEAEAFIRDYGREEA